MKFFSPFCIQELEGYLKKTMEATFAEQRRLDDLRLGMLNKNQEIERIKRNDKNEQVTK